jgi:4-amino-4-deoxy-L-arabinose transferase-like glycosyltransferase
VNERIGLVSVLTLIIVAALAYLPLINQIGYSHDDWYLMASARAEGADVFHEIYSVDRPLRAYVLEPAYRLFGQNVLLYNLSAWAFRVLSALLFLWMLRMLWPKHSHGTFMMALLYVLYPGFLSQYNGIDYQPQIISLALAMLSLALTVYAFFERGFTYRVAGISLSILLGILYLGLVEYEAGFEFIRLMGLFILAGRLATSFRERVLRTIQAWLPYSLILLGFGVWRIFFFQGDRKATNIDVQF